MKTQKIIVAVLAAAMFLTLIPGTATMAEDGANLLTNPGFETIVDDAPEGWALRNNAYAATDYKSAGSYSIALVGTNAYAGQGIPVIAGESYWASGWAYTLPSVTAGSEGTISSWYQYQITYYDGPLTDGEITGNVLGGAVILKNVTISAQGWNLLNITFTPPEGAQSAQFELRTRSDTSNIRFDGLGLSMYGYGGEALVDGGFEDVAPSGALTQWASSKTTSTDKKSGNYSVDITTTGVYAINQKVPIKPSSDYVLSGWYKNITGGYTIPCYRLDIAKADGITAAGGSIAEVRLPKGVTDWVYFEAHVRTGTEAALATLLLRVRDGGTVLFDDVSLKLDKTSLKFTDSAGTKLDNIKAGEDITISYHHVAKTADEDFLYIAGLYEEVGTTDILVSLIALESKTAIVGTPVDINKVVSVPGEGKYMIKVFTWDSLSNMVPYSGKYVLQ